MDNRRIEIAPSILSADFRKLEREVRDAEQAGADRIHCDVMDGRFVPNITFGQMVVEAVKKSVAIPLDVHLMISEPAKHIDGFCRAGADILTFHAETQTDVPAALDAIGRHGVKRGITVNPDKPASLFLPFLDRIDQVLVMTVYAGFGGQSFIAAMLDKIDEVYRAAAAAGRMVDIQVDGGINETTAALCAQKGANVLVAGSYVFGSGDYAGRIRAIRTAAEQAMRRGV